MDGAGDGDVPTGNSPDDANADDMDGYSRRPLLYPFASDADDGGDGPREMGGCQRVQRHSHESHENVDESRRITLSRRVLHHLEHRPKRQSMSCSRSPDAGESHAVNMSPIGCSDESCDRILSFGMPKLTPYRCWNPSCLAYLAAAGTEKIVVPVLAAVDGNFHPNVAAAGEMMVTFGDHMTPDDDARALGL